MGLIQWIFNKLLVKKLKSDKSFTKKLNRHDKSMVDLIESVEVMMKGGSPIAEGFVKSVGVINWEKHEDNGKGFVDVPLKVKYDYVWDKELKLFAPRNKSKRPKNAYTKSFLKRCRDSGKLVGNVAPAVSKN